MMRATISIADSLYAEAKKLAGEQSFSEFARDAIQAQVLLLKRERLAQEMEEGYRAEAVTPSLGSEWSCLDVDGLS